MNGEIAVFTVWQFDKENSVNLFNTRWVQNMLVANDLDFIPIEIGYKSASVPGFLVELTHASVERLIRAACLGFTQSSYLVSDVTRTDTRAKTVDTRSSERLGNMHTVPESLALTKEFYIRQPDSDVYWIISEMDEKVA